MMNNYNKICFKNILNNVSTKTTKQKPSMKTVVVVKSKNVLKKLAKLSLFGGVLETGKIISVKDGVARVKNLKGVLSGEMVLLGQGMIKGMVLSLEHNIVSVVIFGNEFSFKLFISVYFNCVHTANLI